jgi:multidrug resistance protein, MATE family
MPTEAPARAADEAPTVDAPAKALERYEPASTTADEARAIARLALPVVVAQVGLLTMGLVDTWFVGKLGALEMGAVALCDGLFFTVHVLALGTLQATEPLVSQAWGAGEPGRCGAAWRAGLRVALALALPMAFLSVALGWGLQHVGRDPILADLTHDYLWTRVLGTLPLLMYVADRSLLAGMGSTAPPMVMALLANLLNVALDYALIFGEWGAPRLGVVGSGLATAACNWFMWLGLTLWVRRAARHAPVHAATAGGGLPPGLVRLVLLLGLPLGLAHTAEVGAFAAASLLVERFGVAAIAAHQVAIKLASTSFMIAVAVCAATAVRVGQATGARRPADASRSGRVGLVLGAGCMGTAGVVFALFREPLVASFTTDPTVIAAGAGFLLVAAAFQVPDGLQAVASGALRGLGDTRWPMAANIAAHWGVALPLGALLGWTAGLGAQGVWWALAVGLVAAATLLVLRFHRLRDVPPINQP